MADEKQPPPAEPEWQCLRCERIRDRLRVDSGLDLRVDSGLDLRVDSGLDHTRRCPYRGTGRDPDPKG